MTESRYENATTEPRVPNFLGASYRKFPRLRGLSMINSVKDLLPSATEGSQWVALRQECLFSVI